MSAASAHFSPAYRAKARLATPVSELDALRAENAALRARVAELEALPAGATEPATSTATNSERRARR